MARPAVTLAGSGLTRTAHIVGTVALVAGVIAGWPASVGAATPTPLDILNAQDFRQEFGLRADEDYVRLSLSDSKEFSNTDWAVPLSASEVADLRARLEVQHALPAVIDYAEKQPGYGGVFIDQHDKGMPVFLFTTGMAARATEIGKRLPAGTRYEVREVAHTLDDLTALKSKLSNQRDSLLKDGVELVSATVDVVNNRVEAGIIDRTAQKKDVVQAIDERIAVIDERVAVAEFVHRPELRQPQGWSPHPSRPILDGLGLHERLLGAAVRHEPRRDRDGHCGSLCQE